ncbi:MAG TPA: hypothetical protein VGE77_01740 [Nocardioides sp.]
MVLTGDSLLTVYPRNPERVTDKHRHPAYVFGYSDIQVGAPWVYMTREEGRTRRHQTGPVREVRAVQGDLADLGVKDVVDQRAPVKRTALNEAWTGSAELDATVLVTITTYGTWDGTWVITTGPIGYHFLPADPAQNARTWSRLSINGWARTGDTLWVDHTVAPGVWTTVDPAGCGTINTITVEEIDLWR